MRVALILAILGYLAVALAACAHYCGNSNSCGWN